MFLFNLLYHTSRQLSTIKSYILTSFADLGTDHIYSELFLTYSWVIQVKSLIRMVQQFNANNILMYSPAAPIIDLLIRLIIELF